MSRRRTTRAGVLLAAVVGAALPVAGPVAPADADQQCEIGKTAYIPDLSPNLTAIGVPQTWRIARGRGVTVAVVDSGVDAGNAHFRGALVRGTSLIPGRATDDYQGHGTGLAGIIAARVVKGSGMLGVAPESSIMPVRVYHSEGTTGTYGPDTDRLANGIRWATDHGADVINVSMSAGPNDPGLPALRSAVRHALDHDVVVVASVGDTQGAPVTQDRYPAAFPGVIGVAATDQGGVVDDYSVHGSAVDVAAPGQGVLTTFFANGDCQVAQNPETSWSAAFVSGLAAELRGRYPQESVAQITYRIEATAQRPVQGQRDDQQGWGLIQPYDALTMTFDPNREGPPLPGHASQREEAGPASGVHALAAEPDPTAPARSAALWWFLGATGVVALALVLRPLVQAPRRARGESRALRP